MSNRRITPLYVFFFILFSADAWRLLIGAIAATLVAPAVMPPDTLLSGRIVIWIMLVATGWWLAAFPGNRIAAFWKRLVLEKMPPPVR